jgi:hypothetical protein
MNFQEFLDHHSILSNPFADEDAQTDPVFKTRCIDNTYHPSWDKIFGIPNDPSTSIVFGEKGAGKTALRLQIDRHLKLHNDSHPNEKCFVIHYDDFNPYIDRFCERVGKRRKLAKILPEYQLWDHMDAILSIGVTQLVDAILAGKANDANESGVHLTPADVKRFDRFEKRDLLLLTAFYDGSTAENVVHRWLKLRKRLRFWTLRSWWAMLDGWFLTVVALGGLAVFMFRGQSGVVAQYWWVALLVAIFGWTPWLWRFLSRWSLARGISRQLRVTQKSPSMLAKILSHFSTTSLADQPLPNRERTDDRYALLGKFQSLVKTLGFVGIVVLVDRLDEPYLINGSSELMRAMLWPMLDNKFLKQPGFGVKFLLPSELTEYIEREDRDFYQRARLDKQNMVPSLNWTGEVLYDVANARIAACANDGASPRLKDLFNEELSQTQLYEALQSLRVPRHVFRFLYRMIVAHCNRHTSDEPEWQISKDVFQSELAVFNREQTAAAKGLGAG